MRNVDHARGLVTKAEHDLKIARIGLEHEDAPLDTICFHLHQTVEKLLKAALTCKDIEYPMTHDLVRLVDLALQEFPDLAGFREVLPDFFPYALRMRYDGTLYPNRDETISALEITENLRAIIYRLLPSEALP